MMMRRTAFEVNVRNVFYPHLHQPLIQGIIDIKWDL